MLTARSDRADGEGSDTVRADRQRAAHSAIGGGQDLPPAASNAWVGDPAADNWPGAARRAAARLVPHVAHQRAVRRAGLHHGATLHLSGAAHQ